MLGGKSLLPAQMRVKIPGACDYPGELLGFAPGMTAGEGASLHTEDFTFW